jgi:hypothetical protein
MKILAIYSWQKGYESGVGSTQVTVRKYPLSYEDIKELQQDLKQVNNSSAVVITNIIELADDVDEKGEVR